MNNLIIKFIKFSSATAILCYALTAQADVDIAIANALSAPQLKQKMYTEIANPEALKINDGNIQLSVNGTDPKVNGGKRAEIAVFYPYVENEIISYQWDMLIPETFAADPQNRWWILGQWHDQPNPTRGETWATFPANSPPISIFVEQQAGKIGVGLLNNQTKEKKWYPITKNSWFTVKTTVAWNTAEQGLTKFELIDENGKYSHLFAGKNMLNDYYHYLKIGQYRHSLITSTNDVLFRNLKITRPSNPIKKSIPSTGKIALLKLDDLVQVGTHSKATVSSRWQKTIQWLQDENIKASIGLLGESLAGDYPEYFNWIKNKYNTGLFEFWNHGYYINYVSPDGLQKNNAFVNSLLTEQTDMISQAQALAKSKLGITITAFGPHYSNIDGSTYTAIEKNPDIKMVWFFKPTNNQTTPLFVFERKMDLEVPIFQPNPQSVQEKYNSIGKNLAYIALQGHPNQWSDTQFENFKKSILWLREQGVIFMLPGEYRRLSQSTAASQNR